MIKETRNKDIGKRIKTRRIELGISQEALALKVGYSTRGAITKIEKGQNNLRQSRIEKFAIALDCSPAYLLGWDDEEGERIAMDLLSGEDKNAPRLIEALEEVVGTSDFTDDEIAKICEYAKLLILTREA